MEYGTLSNDYRNVGHNVTNSFSKPINTFREAAKSATHNVLNDVDAYPLIEKILSFKAANQVSANLISLALSFISQLAQIRNEYELVNYPPAISYNELDEVVYEWWGRGKKLTIYLTEDNVEYVQVWGLNIHSEMDDGSLTEQKLKLLMCWMEC